MSVILNDKNIMKINSILLKNFRNYNNLNIKFNNNLNIIIGNNAQGKTNIIEAIYFLSITKPIILSNEKNIIMKNKNVAFLKANISYLNYDNSLAINLSTNNKKLYINNREIKKHSEYIGKLKVVLFTPDSLNIIKDSPNIRRRFLNIDISQLNEKYINILNELNVVLRQRNEYLKHIKNEKVSCNFAYLDVLNEKFINLSLTIYDYRKNFIRNLNYYINNIFYDISGYNNLVLEYKTNISFAENEDRYNIFLEKLEKNYQREVFYGTTLYGPHRDDFDFVLSDNNLLLYGSQGQKKMAILALKLAELNVFKDNCGEYPILLLDDLFSELDIEKRNKIISYLNQDIQTIITITDLNNIDKSFIENANLYEIKNGTIVGCITNYGRISEINE